MKKQLKELAERVLKLKDKIKTEEATKNALVLPFLQILGYDIFNPLEVIPEYTADVGNKKGEKVDYCITKDNKEAIIIECKHWKENLVNHKSQLIRYFAVLEDVKIGVLTNGIKYQFFTDLVSENVMDKNPFLELDLENLKGSALQEVEKFHKDNFDITKIASSAGDSKYFNQLKAKFEKELEIPSDDFIKFFVSKEIYSGRLTAPKIVEFRNIIKRALNEKIDTKVRENLVGLKSVVESVEIEQLRKENNNKTPDQIIVESDDIKGTVTTQEELNGYEIVKDILLEKFDSKRIGYRDTKSSLGILLDDTNRKHICRLYFDKEQKFIGIMNEDKSETKISIKKLEHIYKYSNEILKIASFYSN